MVYHLPIHLVPWEANLHSREVETRSRLFVVVEDDYNKRRLISTTTSGKRRMNVFLDIPCSQWRSALPALLVLQQVALLRSQLIFRVRVKSGSSWTSVLGVEQTCLQGFANFQRFSYPYWKLSVQDLQHCKLSTWMRRVRIFMHRGSVFLQLHFCFAMPGSNIPECSGQLLGPCLRESNREKFMRWWTQIKLLAGSARLIVYAACMDTTSSSEQQGENSR